MGNWTNKDSLYIKFGVDKTAAENWGDYRMPGGSRVVEGLIDLSTLPAFGTAGIVSDTVIFPPAGSSTVGANSNSWFIEKIEAIAETAMSTSGSPTLSLGLIQMDRTTTTNVGGTVLINAGAASTLGTGLIVTYTNGSTAAGSFVGTVLSSTVASTGPYYITATLGTANATGKIRIRIHYRGIGTITQ